MTKNHQRLRSRLLVASVFATSTVSATAWAQAPAKPVLGSGEIASNDVYIRCGASLNHYPVCKLNAGARVTIVGEEADWYEILAPEGTFSFISGDYVDTPDGKTGVVNGDKVRVRAGSNLPDFAKLKYAVQQQLSKGAAVTILGRDPDGFLRIKPPAGTTAWVSRAFVSVTEADGMRHAKSAAAPGPEGAASTGANPAASEHTPDGAVTAPGTAAPTDSSLAGTPSMPSRQTLDEIDAATRTELAKPPLERQFDPLIERYQAFAATAGDDVARRYAEARIEQLTNMAALVGTVQKMRALTTEVEAKRNEFLIQRGNIRESLPPIPDALDAQGELRVSAVYPPGSTPARYRLLDTFGGVERTIGYVEIPPGSPIQVDAYLGRYVGVLATAKRLQQGGVNAVPIYVAGDLTLLQPKEEPAETGEPGGE